MANLQMPYGSYYFSTPAATTLSADTWAKAAGTTTAIANENFTHVASNRLRYDGTPTLYFYIACALDMSTASGADTVSMSIYKNGLIVAASELSRKVSNNDVGAAALAVPVQLATDDYIEVWLKTLGGDNLTISGTVTAHLMG